MSGVATGCFENQAYNQAETEFTVMQPAGSRPPRPRSASPPARYASCQVVIVTTSSNQAEAHCRQPCEPCLAEQQSAGSQLLIARQRQCTMADSLQAKDIKFKGVTQIGLFQGQGL